MTGGGGRNSILVQITGATEESNTALVVCIVVGVFVLLLILWTIFSMWKKAKVLFYRTFQY